MAKSANVPEIRVSKRQQQILDFVRQYGKEVGYAPSVREIGRAVGLASPSTVKHHLDYLSRVGLLQRRDRSPRALIVDSGPSRKKSSPTPPTSAVSPTVIEVPVTISEGETTEVPLVGRIAAGAPILAEQAVEEFFALPTRFTGSGQLFALEVHGDSMIDEGILDGDYVIVRAQATAQDGEVVAAMIDDEATVKVLSQTAGHTWLLPRNSNYAPIFGDHAQILGKVVTVIRAV
ncbi:transcriptional repressor LexA [Scrofimicrobium sp. R131]|uniref:LexA repressor n=1 Tax=Scrofimicrobium appendicitidis TaxID=3079930 RepID=A0AAU7V4M4_9ACTO